MALATASAVAQAIVTNPQASIPIQSLHNPVRSAKAADPKPFDGNHDKTEEFVRAIQIAVIMQVDTLADKRMKVLYALSFMHGGTAQVWAANETKAVINGTSQMQTLDIFLENVEKTFGDPDRAHTARAQLHDLRMTPGTCYMLSRGNSRPGVQVQGRSSRVRGRVGQGFSERVTAPT